MMTSATCKYCGAVVVTRAKTTLRFSSTADTFYYAETSTWKGTCRKCRKGWVFTWAELMLPQQAIEVLTSRVGSL